MRVICLLAAVVAGAVLVGAEAQAGEVRVTLQEVEARPGQILATLQTEAQFMRGAGAYGQAVAAPSAPGSVTIVFPNVAPGDYALSVMHDTDGDMQMKRLANGMPAEGWAMSNGGRLSGPPTFAVAKFSVGATPVTITEHMFYPYVPPGQ